MRATSKQNKRWLQAQILTSTGPIPLNKTQETGAYKVREQFPNTKEIDDTN